MKIIIKSRDFLWLALPLTILMPQAHAAEYYVDQNHPSANDQSTGTANNPWKTITKANQTLNAGDTVYIKAGTYNTYIAPLKSGDSTKRITYRNFDNDKVVVQDAAYGVLLDGKSYITVQGINFSNLDRFMYLQNGANHNIIAYNNFDHGRSNAWTGSIIYRNSSYNWVHHSSFSNYGECKPGNGSGSDQGTTLDIGDEESATDASSYNVIENSTLFHGGHHVMGVFSRYNTIRNNYFHNEAWSNNRGHRNLYLQGNEVNSGYTLIEGNRFGYSTVSCNDSNPTTHNVLMTTSSNIFRYNQIFHSVADGLGTSSYMSQGSQYSRGSNNKIYNNTIFNSGLNINSNYKGGSEDSAIWFSNSVNTGNILKNNLYFKNNSAHSGNTEKQTFANNWNGDTQGDPNFVNASTIAPIDKVNTLIPNLNLQPNSPVVDKGGALTTVTTATGSGTSINVSNATYFQDGHYGPPGVVQADWVAVGSIDNTVAISSISGNTLTLAKTINWKNGDPVWLYKKSDGITVLFGAAPEAGAYELTLDQDTNLIAPQNLRIQP